MAFREEFVRYINQNYCGDIAQKLNDGLDLQLSIILKDRNVMGLNLDVDEDRKELISIILKNINEAARTLGQ